MAFQCACSIWPSVWPRFLSLLAQALLLRSTVPLQIKCPADLGGGTSLQFYTLGTHALDVEGQVTCFYRYPDEHLTVELQVARAGSRVPTSPCSFSFPAAILVTRMLGGEVLLQDLAQDMAAWVCQQAGLD